jgi:uridine kinase
MVAGGPLTPADLTELTFSRPARLGDTRLVCIDGPAGSGKTTLAGRIAAALGEDAVVVHLEDLYAGWTLVGAVARLQAGVLRPIAQGRRGSVRPFDWAAARFAPDPVPVPPRAVLVVEGCGSCSRALDACTTLRVWVEAPAELRTARGLARDGVHLAPQWRRWQIMEADHFAADGTRARADVRVDGSEGGP